MRRAALALLPLLVTGCYREGGTTVEPPAASCAMPGPTASGTTVITASVNGSRVTTARDQWDVKRGSAVRILVISDHSDEVHVHTYDRKVEVKPACAAVLDFVASIPGTVEVELEKGALHLFDLRVS